ncbi:Co2+/Mg2+ efflux protein ApaG [Tenacibaculum sp. M341]|uniref:Co2+/Mg2+ efflux protein ApaG n=1 Tax=Tenacibaculum sp. M341 TaxID=2530339 RepID=UPI00104C5A5D|nr:Co2+/Mg2+ efflux protein ApaG [Tenacibaculum sp. M341]TCI94316.1 Co2+/Mg2+ efflux protein ApaG [Tenacibaculum sp. M341]
MVEQVTKGIKITVKTTYNGTMYRGYMQYYAFSYFISIKNFSEKTVQLTDRFWTILDALNDTEYVEGKGVVGQTPVLKPQEEYNYTSNCFLLSSTGAMKGKYRMVDIENNQSFFATIPTFQLNTTPSLN